MTKDRRAAIYLHNLGMLELIIQSTTHYNVGAVTVQVRRPVAVQIQALIQAQIDEQAQIDGITREE